MAHVAFSRQAVLECKWPTNSSAFVRWNRIRNTIKAIAQFRRALKSRRLSVYSNNSESDFDRMSRGSGDSYLEDGGTKAQVNGAANPAELASSVASASRGIVVAPKTEFVNDLINVESQEERVSTGWYKGMNLFLLFPIACSTSEFFLSISSSYCRWDE